MHPACRALHSIAVDCFLMEMRRNARLLQSYIFSFSVGFITSIYDGDGEMILVVGDVVLDFCFSFRIVLVQETETKSSSGPKKSFDFDFLGVGVETCFSRI